MTQGSISRQPQKLFRVAEISGCCQCAGGQNRGFACVPQRTAKQLRYAAAGCAECGLTIGIVVDVEYIAAENAVMKAGKIIAQDTTEGLVKQIEAKVWQGNIPMEQLSRWEYRLRVVNLRNEPDGTVTLRYLADAPQLPDSVPAQPRLEDLYLWLFPEEMEEAK